MMMMTTMMMSAATGNVRETVSCFKYCLLIKHGSAVGNKCCLQRKISTLDPNFDFSKNSSEIL